MRLILAVVAGSLVVAIPVLGCGMCNSFNGNPLSLPHPQAIEIAVATRAALDKGILRDAEAKTSGWGRKTSSGSGFDALKTWLEKKNARKVAADRDPVSLHIVLIDTSETAAVHFRSGAIVLDPQPRGSGDVVLATTSHGLRALLSGEQSLDNAVKMKLAVVEGRQALVDALAP